MQRRNAWTTKDDQSLKYLYENTNLNWYQIAEKFQNRNHKQCKERYFQHVRPGLNQQKLKKQEIKLLFSLLKRHRYKWVLIHSNKSKIVEEFKDRTLLQIKNCFYTVIRRALRRLFKAIGYKQTTKMVNMFKSKFLSDIYSIGGSIETSNLKQKFQNLINDVKMMSVKQIKLYGNLEQAKGILESVINFNKANFSSITVNQQLILNKIKNREHIFKIVNLVAIPHSPEMSEQIDYLQESFLDYFQQRRNMNILKF